MKGERERCSYSSFMEKGKRGSFALRLLLLTSLHRPPPSALCMSCKPFQASFFLILKPAFAFFCVCDAGLILDGAVGDCIQLAALREKLRRTKSSCTLAMRAK